VLAVCAGVLSRATTNHAEVLIIYFLCSNWEWLGGIPLVAVVVELVYVALFEKSNVFFVTIGRSFFLEEC
jgi:hypothetical protein